MRIIQSLVIAFTTWILTGLLNGLLSGYWLVFSGNSSEHALICLLAFIGTLVFSIPGFIVFWMMLLANCRKENLFHILLKTGLVIAGLSSMLLFLIPADELKGQVFFLGCCSVISILASIMAHHALIQLFYPTEKITQHV